MTNLVPASFGALSAKFAGQAVENELGAGVQGGFGMVGYKGKVWSIRKGGEETPLMRPDGSGPMNSIDVVVLKAPAAISKIFYEQGYVEGSNASPDCYSTNGVIPAAGASKKQSAACAACPKNAWGSRITPAGKQGKACSDSKRLAVVPLNDLRNEAYGGPLLLRIPAASLSDMANFGQKMTSMGFPSHAYGVRISFDVKESYPKFVFQAVRPLSDDEADIVISLRDGPEVARILAEDEVQQAAIAAPAAQTLFLESPQPPTTKVVALHTQQTAQPQAPVQTQTPPPSSIGAGFSTSAPTARPPSLISPATATTPATAPTNTFAQTSPPDGIADGAPGIGGMTDASPTGVPDFDAQLDALLG